MAPLPRPKRLEFVPSSVLQRAFNRFVDEHGYRSEARALEALIREGLERYGFLACGPPRG